MPGTLLSALCVSCHFTCLYPNCPVRKVHYNLCFTEGEFEVCDDAKAQAEVMIFTMVFEKLPILQRHSFPFMSLHFVLWGHPVASSSPHNMLLYTFVSLLGLLPLPKTSFYSPFTFRAISCGVFPDLSQEDKGRLSQYIYMAPHHVILSLPICTSVTVTRPPFSSRAEAITLFYVPRSQNNVLSND